MINFGIIGYGQIGYRHRQEIENNLSSQLVAISDIDDRKLSGIQKEKRGIETYRDYRKMIELEDSIDIIAICTPNYLHCQMTVDSLTAGKNVLCEKPMALTTEDCQKMIDVSLKKNKSLFIVKQNRYNPPVQAVKKFLQNGVLGKLYCIIVNAFWNRTDEYYDNSDWRGDEKKEGGALFTQFSHFVDLMYWFAGDVDPEKVVTKNYSHPTIEIEDTGTIILKFKSGCIGSFNYTNCAYKSNMEGSITLFGENGTVKIGGRYLNKLEYQNIKNIKREDVSGITSSNDYGTYQGTMSNHDKVYENVVSTLENRDEICVSGIEGMKTVEFIEKVYQLK